MVSMAGIVVSKFAQRFTQIETMIMYKHFSSSLLIFGLAIFVGLMPLTFAISPTGIQLLLETSYKYWVWCGQASILFLLLPATTHLSENQMLALAMLYVFVPLAFTFTEDGASFLILHHHTSSVLSWSVAGVLLSKLLFASNFSH